MAHFLTVLLFVFGLFVTPVAAKNQKYAAIVMEARSGNVLHDEFSQEKRYPASLTKMMTLYLLFEELEKKRLKLTTKMLVSKKAASQPPSRLGLKPGKTIAVKDALLALMTKSANDAAVVVAEHVGGSVEAFARRMTQKARALGMRGTVFKNPHGLPNKDQYTTAQDMATLGRALLTRFPSYYRYFRTQAFWYEGKKYRNHNHLLGKVKGVDGIKTGYINASGFNLVSSAIRDGTRLVAVVMGGETRHARDRRMAQLLEVSFKDVFDGQKTVLAHLKPMKKPYSVKTAPIMMAASSDRKIVPAQLPSHRQNAFEQESQATLSVALKGHDPIGDKIRTMDPIGDKIRRIEGRAHLPQGDRTWSVQIGAFSKADDAHDFALKYLTELSPSYEAKVLVTISKRKRKNLYRARLTGLTEAQAGSICAFLKKRGQDCLPIKPHRSPVMLSASNS